MHYLTLAAVHIPEMTDGMEPDKVISGVCDLMEPYNAITENPEYLEFNDKTDDLKCQYDKGTVDCIKLPQGKIIINPSAVYGTRFVIRDGKVFETGCVLPDFAKRRIENE